MNKFVDKMPESEYHAHPAHGSTAVRAALKSVAHFRHHQTRQFEETAAMRLGTAVHCAVLEPKRYEAEFVPPPCPVDIDAMNYRHRNAAELLAKGEGLHAIADSLKVKEGTARKYLDMPEVKALADHYREHPPEDTPSLTASELEQVENITAAVHRHPAATSALGAPGRAEFSAFASLDGVPVKGRFDRYTPDARMIWDLKTTSQPASLASVQKTIANYNYHVQAALYAGIADEITGQPHRFGWIFVETRPPYSVGVYVASIDMMNAGAELVDRAINTIRLAVDFPDCFDGYSMDVQHIELPRWAKPAELTADDIPF